MVAVVLVVLVVVVVVVVLVLVFVVVVLVLVVVFDGIIAIHPIEKSSKVKRKAKRGRRMKRAAAKMHARRALVPPRNEMHVLWG